MLQVQAASPTTEARREQGGIEPVLCGCIQDASQSQELRQGGGADRRVVAESQDASCADGGEGADGGRGC